MRILLVLFGGSVVCAAAFGVVLALLEHATVGRSARARTCPHVREALELETPAMAWRCLDCRAQRPLGLAWCRTAPRRRRAA